jgi:hypothetical protein
MTPLFFTLLTRFFWILEETAVSIYGDLSKPQRELLN